MNWHLEHHMYASVPCYNLSNLHKILADGMPETRTLLSSWKEMRETFKIQQHKPGYVFDTKVPSKLFLNYKNYEKNNITSIGDLAPQSIK